MKVPILKLAKGEIIDAMLGEDDEKMSIIINGTEFFLNSDPYLSHSTGGIVCRSSFDYAVEKEDYTRTGSVEWEILEDWDNEDESEACDWYSFVVKDDCSTMIAQS